MLINCNFTLIKSWCSIERARLLELKKLKKQFFQLKKLKKFLTQLSNFLSGMPFRSPIQRRRQLLATGGPGGLNSAPRIFEPPSDGRFLCQIQLGVWGRCMSPRWSCAEPWWRCRGGNPGGFEDPVFYSA